MVKEEKVDSGKETQVLKNGRISVQSSKKTTVHKKSLIIREIESGLPKDGVTNRKHFHAPTMPRGRDLEKHLTSK